MQNKISTVIIGGTFDPVHIGHMHIADEVQRAFHSDLVIFVPSYISAHKTMKKAAASQHRLQMLKIACRKINVEIETCEIDRKGISYTIDTIRYIRKKYNLKEKPGLLIGDDLAEGFNKWKTPEMIAEEAQLIVACRDQRDEIDFGFKHFRVNNLMLNISSSEIRRRLSENLACRFLMPDGVYDYIRENELYGDLNA